MGHAWKLESLLSLSYVDNFVFVFQPFSQQLSRQRYQYTFHFGLFLFMWENVMDFIQGGSMRREKWEEVLYSLQNHGSSLLNLMPWWQPLSVLCSHQRWRTYTQTRHRNLCDGKSDDLYVWLFLIPNRRRSFLRCLPSCSSFGLGVFFSFFLPFFADVQKSYSVSSYSSWKLSLFDSKPE